MPLHPRAFLDVLHTLHNAASAAGRPDGVRLLAVAKTQPTAAIAELFDAGQRAFGENYVQEARAKQAELRAIAARIEWHLIGHLQSNKARDAAKLFDWVQTVDRPKLVAALAQHRAPTRPPLNVLVQVNIDDESSKHGCRPDAVTMLADAIAAQPRLALRGLMAIPAPHPDPDSRRPAFRYMKQLFEELGARHPRIDTLSMGMSDDYEIAIEEGATMVRMGTALFGERPSKTEAEQ
ncbi:MAG: YggS family pyridoxal phosphate-dependent enzyme [Luteimonas sp.]